MIKILSLDLQGTLSDSKFSDYFWLELLPKKYAQKFNLSIQEAKDILKQKFKEYGVYNILYYDDKYWSDYLDFNTLEEISNFEVQPHIDNNLYNLIQKINLPKIIISTTTNLFIEYELKENIKDFNKIYSCVDTFNTGGKTPEVFKKVCEELKVKPNEILHIGDNKIMDVDNAIEVGVNAIIYDGDIDKLKNEINKYMEV